jgi:quercetin dioxygenase-like cupin family protein
MKLLRALPLFALSIPAPAEQSRAGPESARPAAGETPLITISAANSLPSTSGDVRYFTGQVHIVLLFPAEAPSRLSGALVTFEPGARTAWHSHPLGQTLIVTEGAGWVQQWGGPVREIRQGEVIRIPPGIKHWHGATAATRMRHIALQEQLDGKVVEWMEQVSEEQYRGHRRQRQE